jgi:dephospho-CoA kinase
LKIAITGGLGSGKSTVSQLLAARLCCELVNTDELCRRLLFPGEEGYIQFIESFGKEFILPDGHLDRAELREAVFRDSAVKDRLESVLHPLVLDIVKKKGESSRLLLVEVPLLFEVGWQDDFDMCVLVYVPEEKIFERVAERDGHSREIIRAILDNQMPLEEKLHYTSVVIDNSSTFVSTVLQVNHLGRLINLVRMTRKAQP